MNPEIYQAMMKEWYWGVIIAALVAVAFCPSFLKGVCLSCKKRSVTSVDVDDGLIKNLKEAGVAMDELPPFTMLYRCTKCGAKFKRVRSGPLENGFGVLSDRL